MLKLRLQRVGKKHDPSFKVVLTDSRNGPQSGKFLEVVGHYDARRGDPVINLSRVKYWIEKGAQPSATLSQIVAKLNPGAVKA